MARRVIERRHRAVYVDALAPLAARGHLFAALLACNETAFLSHRTAAAVHGLRPLNVHEIEVTVVADHTPRHDGFIVHRTSRTPLPDETRVFDGLRIASPARTLVDLAARESGQELARLIAEAARRRLLDVPRIEASIAHRPRAAGIENLREALARYRPARYDKSRFERDFAAWLAQHPEIPEPRRNVLLDQRFELDSSGPSIGWWSRPTASRIT